MDVAGTDAMIRLYAEQKAIYADSSGNKVIETTHQPQSINGKMYVYDADDGTEVATVIRATIQAYNIINLRNNALSEGDIVWVSYNY